MKDENSSLDSLFNEIASQTIKKYREQKNMSLEDVVSKMKNNISRQMLFKYENNLARMKNGIFIDICQVLNINPNEVFQEINKRVFDTAFKLNQIVSNDIDFPIIDENGNIQYGTFFGIPADECVYDDNNKLIEINRETIQIPVLGTIKAGIAVEAQQDILEYIEIPKKWLNGGKKFYGLKISGDSMYPKYDENDIVIFEHTEDYAIANNKDCAVMVNGDDVTFKTVSITDNGITLIPYNPNNQDNYQPTFYNKEEIERLPVRIIGIAREKRTRL